ncbi:MAG: DNA cytosine methyltransferase, partial [bacterium]
MKKWTFADLFSGAGGMSYGFFAHPSFELVGAVDAQLGKPSSGKGALDCNSTYALNMGVEPFEADLLDLDGSGLKRLLRDKLAGRELTILLACPPCTGFSRTNPNNHMKDDPRNSLVARTSLWVEALCPRILMMENARELLNGNFSHHFEILERRLRELGYSVHSSVHMLNTFGLPQKRERALVIATRRDIEIKSLEDLWNGFEVNLQATHVRRAISDLPAVDAGLAFPDDPMHVSPRMAVSSSIRRVQLMPKDGGSWADLRNHPEAEKVLTPAMLRSIAKSDFGSHPDVYGRLWWDRPAVTIKRECAHVGNGRYTHPEQDRLCTVREMAILQGFPRDYRFASTALSNMYRHIGDAVPPLISFQLAWAANWMLSGIQPDLRDCILPRTSLRPGDIRRAKAKSKQLI